MRFGVCVGVSAVCLHVDYMCVAVHLLRQHFRCWQAWLMWSVWLSGWLMGRGARGITCPWQCSCSLQMRPGHIVFRRGEGAKCYMTGGFLKKTHGKDAQEVAEPRRWAVRNIATPPITAPWNKLTRRTFRPFFITLYSWLMISPQICANIPLCAGPCHLSWPHHFRLVSSALEWGRNNMFLARAHVSSKRSSTLLRPRCF